MLKMFSSCFNAHIDTSDHGLSHAFKDPMMLIDDFVGIYDMLVSSFAILVANKLRLLSVPTVKNLMDLD